MFGYQVAFCYRNTAIYAGVFLFGILFGLARDRKVKWLRWLTKPLNGWLFIVLLMPIFVDGVTHMLGLREDTDMSMTPQFGDFFVGSQVGSFNWWLRIITGLLAALAGVWFAYPRMQRQVEASEAMRQAYLWEAAMRYAMRNRRPGVGGQGPGVGDPGPVASG